MQFKNFQKPKIKLKNTPSSLKKSKIYMRRSEIKKFYKRDPPKGGILIQIIILKISKTKNQTQKRPPKVPKNQKHI